VHVALYEGEKRLGYFSTFEIQCLSEDWAPVLGRPPLFHTTISEHTAGPEAIHAALPELRAALQRMRDQGIHLMESPPTRQLGERPPLRWLYDSLVVLVEVFEDAVRRGITIRII